MILGLTGGIASGKTTAANFLASLGVEQVDLDIIAHQIVQPGQPALEAIRVHFGNEVILGDGHLNRRRLREIVFQQPEQKTWLETLLHPIIRQVADQQLQSMQQRITNNKVPHPYCLLVSPLLFETGAQSQCNKTLLISIPESMQIQRVMSRDQCSEEQAKAIIATQMPLAQKLILADYVIENRSDLPTLERKLMALHTELTKL